MKIYVIDTETTSLDCREGRIVEVAVASLDTDDWTVAGEYASLVGWDPDADGFSDAERGAWVFSNTSMTMESLADAPSPAEVAGDLADLLDGEALTAYNTRFDYGFLSRDPWLMGERFEVIRAPCIMQTATPLLGGWDEWWGDYSWVSLDTAYSVLCADDPAGIGRQTRRAWEDALLAAHVLGRLARGGHYRWGPIAGVDRAGRDCANCAHLDVKTPGGACDLLRARSEERDGPGWACSMWEGAR